SISAIKYGADTELVVSAPRRLVMIAVFSYAFSSDTPGVNASRGTFRIARSTSAGIVRPLAAWSAMIVSTSALRSSSDLPARLAVPTLTTLLLRMVRTGLWTGHCVMSSPKASLSRVRRVGPADRDRPGAACFCLANLRCRACLPGARHRTGLFLGTVPPAIENAGVRSSAGSRASRLPLLDGQIVVRRPVHGSRSSLVAQPPDDRCVDRFGGQDRGAGIQPRTAGTSGLGCRGVALDQIRGTGCGQQRPGRQDG